MAISAWREWFLRSDKRSRTSHPTVPTRTPNRRGYPRYPCSHAFACRLLPPEADETLVATGRDLSLSGIGMLVPRRLQPGMLMDVDVRQGSLPAGAWRLVLVVRVCPADSGSWLAGGNFYTDLTPSELLALTT
jgi:hypothetical protein